MNKIEKKQIPQLIVLIVLSVGVFGFFIVRMIAPTPAAAQAPKSAKAMETDAANDVEIAPAPAPTALMRDPFLPGVADTAALAVYEKSMSESAPAPRRAASARPSFLNRTPSVNPIPGLSPMPISHGAPLANMGALPAPGSMSGGAPVAAAPSAPITWTVTGVMGGDGGVAILRDGEQRRIVHQGDMLADGLRVAHIARTSIVLKRDGQTYRLPLGGSKDTAPKAPAEAAPIADAPAAPTETTIAP